jgi:carbon monoxide dehydrogenase subunit G
VLIKHEFEVPQSVEECWDFLQDIPQVASCLPGATLEDEVGPDQYAGKVRISMGPVKMDFAGQAEVTERDEATRTIVLDAAGADAQGRGQAAMGLVARLVPTAGGTRVIVEQDLQLSGAAAQYGRGMVNDVSAVLIRDFADNMKARLDAQERGVSPDQVRVKAAGGLSIGIKAAWMALMRVARRFFAPYDPQRV